MDIKSLEKKKIAVETSFEELKTEQKAHSDKVSELETELIKLQGEYRLITELIDAENNTPKVVKEK